MADKFPNLPGIPVNIVDGNLTPDQTPGGPTVAILGTATKGPADAESTVLSGAGAITKYGSVGSLGRGLAEAFQGGAANAVGFRILATAGKIEHIGDDSGAAGISVETVSKGGDALELYNILYNQQTDRLKIYDVETGIVVYDQTGDVVAVDLGVLNVSGEAVNDETAEDQVFGSIGKPLVVADDETDQTASIDATHTVLTLNPAIAGLNLGKLGFANPTSTPVMCQLRSNDETQLREELVSSINVGAGTVTLENAIDAAYYDDGADTGLHNDAAVFHDVRFVSLATPVRADRVVTNRLPRTGASVTSPDILVTPGSNFNGSPKLTDALGLAVDSSLEEVEPHKMNLYEALLDGALALEASDIDILVLMDAYLDDPALDGQISDETKLPSTEAEGLMLDSAENLPAGVDEVVLTTIAGFADRATMTFADEAERDLAQTKLAAAGRGATWLVFSSPQGAAFGEFRDTDEIVRAARILNCQESDGSDTDVIVHFDREVGFSFVDANEVVEGSLTPAFQAFNTDLLFFHREKEVDGELVHYWYTAKADPDGNPYNEVNFAYKLAAICHDMTENETAVIGCIGVRPPSNHFNPAAIATWIGASPEYDDDGDVSANGSGLLGNKFVAGRGLSDLYNDANQFDPGFKATETGELDDTEVLQDVNGFDIDMGKYLSVVATWPTMTNASDSTGLGYISSGAAIYAGLLAGLAPWRGSTAKQIGGRAIRLPRRLAKRHLNSLAGARYILFSQNAAGAVTVVDGPSAALPTSDYTRNMTMRLISEVIRQLRDAGRPFLGDPLSAVRKSAMETKMKKVLAELQRLSSGALESFELGITQSPLDKVRGTAKVTLALRVINELRKLTISVALTL